MLYNSKLILLYVTCWVVLYCTYISSPHKVFGKSTIKNTCETDNCIEETLSADDEHFQCAIKRQKGWEEFKRKNNITIIGNGGLNNDEAAPVITRVSLYFLEYGRMSRVAALNISFKVPAKSHNKVTKAVLLTFTSVNDTTYRDEYFADNPGYRLFDFSSRTPTSVIPEQQRWLQYPCIYGLEDRMDTALAYVLSLTSFTTKNARPNTIRHQITTYTKKREDHVWIPTLVTSVVPNTCKVRVVFEALPTKWVAGRTIYNVALIDTNFNTLIASFKIPHQSERYECTFNNTAEGSFIVKLKVENHNFPVEIQESKSYRFDIYSPNMQRKGVIIRHKRPDGAKLHVHTSLPSKAAAPMTASESHTSTNYESLDTILFTSAGCFVGLFLVVMLTLCFFRYKKGLSVRNSSPFSHVGSEPTLNNSGNTQSSLEDDLTGNEQNTKNPEQPGTKTLFLNEYQSQSLLDDNVYHKHHMNLYYQRNDNEICPLHGKRYISRKKRKRHDIILEGSDEDMKEIQRQMLRFNFSDSD